MCILYYLSMALNQLTVMHGLIESESSTKHTTNRTMVNSTNTRVIQFNIILLSQVSFDFSVS